MGEDTDERDAAGDDTDEPDTACDDAGEPDTAGDDTDERDAAGDDAGEPDTIFEDADGLDLETARVPAVCIGLWLVSFFFRSRQYPVHAHLKRSGYVPGHPAPD